MRLKSVAAVLVVAVTSLPGGEGSQSGASLMQVGCVRDHMHLYTGTVDCRLEERRSQRSQRPARPRPEVDGVVVRFLGFGLTPELALCLEWRSSRYPQGPPTGTLERLANQDRHMRALGLPWCDGGAGVAPGAQEVATEVVRRVALPTPGPRVEPGRMLVGLRAFLEAGMPMVHSFGEDTPLGPITVQARAVLHVDWGDGTVTGPHGDAGGPYPHGSINHVFQHRGIYTITVTATWVAEWTVAGQAGVIDTGLATVGVIEDFPVEERQAVITSG